MWKIKKRYIFVFLIVVCTIFITLVLLLTLPIRGKRIEELEPEKLSYVMNQ